MNKDIVYIVAGDEMKKLMERTNSSLNIIPFREDLSKGSYKGYDINEEFIESRANNFGVSTKEYYEKIKPIIELDFSKDYLLVFGEDACCKSNLEFMINYLKYHNYKKEIKVRIVNEYDLTIIKEYII